MSPDTRSVADDAALAAIARLLAERRDGDAERRAAELVTRRPDCGAAWKAVGVARLRLGRDALAVLHQASLLLPHDGEVHELMAGALQRAGHDTAALAACQRALAIHPGNTRALRRQVALLIALRDYRAAAESCRAMLTYQPDDAATLLDLGNLCRLLGDNDQAAACYRRTIAIAPTCADAHFNLGVVFGENGEYAQATACYSRAIDCDAQHARAHLNLGNMLEELARHDEAVASYRRALTIDPGYAEAQLGLGNVFAAQGLTAPAIDCYRQALTARPQLAEAHFNLGNALKDNGRFDEALASYRQAIRCAPDFYVAHSSLIYTQTLIAGQDPQTTYDDAANFGRQVARHIEAQADWPNSPLPQRRLRIGLVSGDLRKHPVGYFVESVLDVLRERHDLEITAYTNNPHGARGDALSARLAGLCHRWRPITGIADATVARQIGDDAIDILVDLSGHTEHNRLPLFAHKAAPVQASWLGFHASSGIAAIDYIVADRWTVPQSQERYFTERVWRLPRTLWCLTPPAFDLVPSPLPALGKGYLTFASFNRIEKLNADVFAVWARILHSIAGSRLHLKAAKLDLPDTRERIIGEFAALGIDRERLIVDGASPRAAYLAAYRDVDLALDPFPYAGATTTVEALWMGVPTVTLSGDRFVERQSVSLLMNAGLPQCIADDPDEYVARVQALVADLPALARLRGELRAQVLHSPLFDAPRLAGDLAAAWRGMWQHWCRAHPGENAPEDNRLEKINQAGKDS